MSTTLKIVAIGTMVIIAAAVFFHFLWKPFYVNYQYQKCVASVKTEPAPETSKVTANDYTADLEAIDDPAFTAYVSHILDKRCPYYEPDGAHYRACLVGLMAENENLYNKSSSTPQQIDDQCQSLARNIEGLPAGEIILLCIAFKLSTP